MRTTIRIDDDLLRELRRRAAQGKVPLTHVLNQVLRQGLTSKPRRRAAYREKVFSLGAPQRDLNKALAIAAAEEDAEVIRKLALRK